MKSEGSDLRRSIPDMDASISKIDLIKSRNRTKRQIGVEEEVIMPTKRKKGWKRKRVLGRRGGKQRGGAAGGKGREPSGGLAATVAAKRHQLATVDVEEIQKEVEKSSVASSHPKRRPAKKIKAPQQVKKRLIQPPKPRPLVPTKLSKAAGEALQLEWGAPNWESSGWRYLGSRCRTYKEKEGKKGRWHSARIVDYDPMGRRHLVIFRRSQKEWWCRLWEEPIIIGEQLYWAKLKGYPWWPAQVFEINEHCAKYFPPRPGSRMVIFFGNNEQRCWVKPQMLRPLDRDTLPDGSKGGGGKKGERGGNRSDLAEALKAAMEERSEIETIRRDFTKHRRKTALKLTEDEGENRVGQRVSFFRDDVDYPQGKWINAIVRQFSRPSGKHLLAWDVPGMPASWVVLERQSKVIADRPQPVSSIPDAKDGPAVMIKKETIEDGPQPVSLKPDAKDVPAVIMIKKEEEEGSTGDQSEEGAGQTAVPTASQLVVDSPKLVSAKKEEILRLPDQKAQGAEGTAVVSGVLAEALQKGGIEGEVATLLVELMTSLVQKEGPPDCAACQQNNKFAGYSCNLCQKFYHVACLDPARLAVTRDLEGTSEWVCAECVSCRGCSKMEKETPLLWDQNLLCFLCSPCRSMYMEYQYCPICGKVWGQVGLDEQMLKCDDCEYWVHADCEGLNKEEYEEVTAETHPVFGREYQCRTCRPPRLEALVSHFENEDKYGLFIKPVTDEIAPGYSDVVKHPMDLTTMRKKIEELKYRGVQELRWDWELMVKNALSYNLKGSRYHTIAKQFFRTIQKEWPVLAPATQPGEDEQAVHDILVIGKVRIKQQEEEGEKEVQKHLEEEIDFPELAPVTDPGPFFDVAQYQLTEVEAFYLSWMEICLVCGSGEGAGKAPMVCCSDCGEAFHIACMNVPVATMNAAARSTWRCLNCKICELCGTGEDEGDYKMIFCELCDRSYHMSCLRPPLPAVPEGKWVCGRCIDCVHCAKPAPLGSWSHLAQICTACFHRVELERRSVCTICSKSTLDDLALGCRVCKQEVHASCDGRAGLILNLKHLKLNIEPNVDKSYICPPCAKDKPPKNSLEEKKQKLMEMVASIQNKRRILMEESERAREAQVRAVWEHHRAGYINIIESARQRVSFIQALNPRQRTLHLNQGHKNLVANTQLAAIKEVSKTTGQAEATTRTPRISAEGMRKVRILPRWLRARAARFLRYEMRRRAIRVRLSQCPADIRIPLPPNSTALQQHQFLGQQQSLLQLHSSQQSISLRQQHAASQDRHSAASRTLRDLMEFIAVNIFQEVMSEETSQLAHEVIVDGIQQVASVTSTPPAIQKPPQPTVYHQHLMSTVSKFTAEVASIVAKEAVHEALAGIASECILSLRKEGAEASATKLEGGGTLMKLQQVDLEETREDDAAAMSDEGRVSVTSMQMEETTAAPKLELGISNAPLESKEETTPKQKQAAKNLMSLLSGPTPGMTKPGALDTEFAPSVEKEVPQLKPKEARQPEAEPKTGPPTEQTKPFRTEKKQCMKSTTPGSAKHIPAAAKHIPAVKVVKDEKEPSMSEPELPGLPAKGEVDLTAEEAKIGLPPATMSLLSATMPQSLAAQGRTVGNGTAGIGQGPTGANRGGVLGHTATVTAANTTPPGILPMQPPSGQAATTSNNYALNTFGTRDELLDWPLEKLVRHATLAAAFLHATCRELGFAEPPELVKRLLTGPVGVRCPPEQERYTPGSGQTLTSLIPAMQEEAIKSEVSTPKSQPSTPMYTSTPCTPMGDLKGEQALKSMIQDMKVDPVKVEVQATEVPPVPVQSHIKEEDQDSGVLREEPQKIKEEEPADQNEKEESQGPNDLQGKEIMEEEPNDASEEAEKPKIIEPEAKDDVPLVRSARLRKRKEMTQEMEEDPMDAHNANDIGGAVVKDEEAESKPLALRIDLKATSPQAIEEAEARQRRHLDQQRRQGGPPAVVGSPRDFHNLLSSPTNSECWEDLSRVELKDPELSSGWGQTYERELGAWEDPRQCCFCHRYGEKPQAETTQADEEKQDKEPEELIVEGTLTRSQSSNNQKISPALMAPNVSCGRLLPIPNDPGAWVHAQCALWTPETYERLGFLYQVTAARARGKFIKCSFCEDTGATLGCNVPRCQVAYHFPCAVEAGMAFMDNRNTYCAKHRFTSVPGLARGNILASEELANDANYMLSVTEKEEKKTPSDPSGFFWRTGALTIHSLGQLVPSVAGYHTTDYLFPQGFRSTRIMWSQKRPRTRCLYICDIEQYHGRTLFRITPSDDLATEIKAWSAEDCYTKLIRRVMHCNQTVLRDCQVIPPCRKVPVFGLNGPQFFGLADKVVRKLLEKLPGAVDAALERAGTNEAYHFRCALPSKKAVAAWKKRRALDSLAMDGNNKNLLKAKRPLVEGEGCARAQGKTWLKESRVTRLLQRHVRAAEEEDTLDLSSREDGSTEDGEAAKNLGSIQQQYRQLKSRPNSERLVAQRSTIHGWGLFTKEDLDKHSMIIEYTGEIVRQCIADRREAEYERLGLGSCYLFRLDSDAITDGTCTGCMARFINHSCEPNAYAKLIQVSGVKKIVIFAKRAIKAGEEVTYDYKFPLEHEKLHCHCGASSCSGAMN